MKVKDLIEALSSEDENADVHFVYNYGDHWRTLVAPAVNYVEEGRVMHSDYHSMDKVMDEDDKKWDEAQAVVLLCS